MKIDIPVFMGEQPSVSPHLLAGGYSQLAVNVDLGHKDLRGWRALEKDSAISETGPESFFKWEEGSNEHWIISDNDLDHSPGPIANDQYERIYFTGESEPRFFANDYSGDFTQDTHYYKLGIPAPSGAPTIASGYTPGADYRAYIYTYVNKYGDEGPPSDVVDIDDYGSGDVVLGDFVEYVSGRGLETGLIRIYQATSSASGVAEFQYLSEFNISGFNFVTGTWTDDGSYDPAEVCPSVDWDPPDDGLIGLISLPNGRFAGFVENELCFSEAFYPHAWPSQYRRIMDYPIVSIGNIGTTVVVLTTAHPYLLWGDDPQYMSKKKLPGLHPCLSKRATQITEMGVLFSSAEGVGLANADGTKIITIPMLTQKDWAAFEPASMHGKFYNGKYFLFYSNADENKGLLIDFNDSSITRLNFYSYALCVVDDTGLYMIADDTDIVDEDDPPVTMPLAIKLWEGDDYNYLLYRWKSKLFISPEKLNFAVARVTVDSKFYDDILDVLAENAVFESLNSGVFPSGLMGSINELTIDTLPLNGDLLYDLTDIDMTPDINFKLYADEELKFTKAVSTDDTFRLPGGFEERKHEIEVSGYVPVKMVEIAQSEDELAT